MIRQVRSRGNDSQVGKPEHQQLDAAALEVHPRLGAVAAPLHEAPGPLLAGLSLAGPGERMSASGLGRVEVAVRDAARSSAAARA